MEAATALAGLHERVDAGVRDVAGVLRGQRGFARSTHDHLEALSFGSHFWRRRLATSRKIVLAALLSRSGGKRTVRWVIGGGSVG